MLFTRYVRALWVCDVFMCDGVSCAPIPLVSTQEGQDWSGATAIAVAVGQPTDELRYYRSSSLHLWLLKYEFSGEWKQSDHLL